MFLLIGSGLVQQGQDPGANKQEHPRIAEGQSPTEAAAPRKVVAFAASQPGTRPSFSATGAHCMLLRRG